MWNTTKYLTSSKKYLTSSKTRVRWRCTEWQESDHEHQCRRLVISCGTLALSKPGGQPFIHHCVLFACLYLTATMTITNNSKIITMCKRSECATSKTPPLGQQSNLNWKQMRNNKEKSMFPLSTQNQSINFSLRSWALSGARRGL